MRETSKTTKLTSAKERARQQWGLIEKETVIHSNDNPLFLTVDQRKAVTIRRNGLGKSKHRLEDRLDDFNGKDPA